ncbi:MmcQ/YjbR family DNA-binding protein [Pseudonocardia endophytica]|uniref:YjbR protein n=1 Tax=Pseudonocardia endophytica TaxID=401976 RepID=A0A4V2PHG5_PSEEN|nr:MmcQ/YjbR family DNA-binding protein [Pseudonocardia endophytica]TCK20616.1 YjbR protein [Pseudonocardia endophytica]
MPAAALTRVRALCLALPSVTEAPTHGAPTWFAGGRRSFAKYVDPAEHHVDEETGPALWAAAPPGARHQLVAADPERFFAPRFGGSAWVGVRLAHPDWAEVAEILEDAYRQVAQRHLVERIGS